MTRLLWAVALLALGYRLHRPVCEREHARPRHLDPAIVRQPPEGDDDIQADAGLPVTVGVRNVPAATWPETLEHEGWHAPDGHRPACRRCDADWWLRQRGARPG